MLYQMDCFSMCYPKIRNGYISIFAEIDFLCSLIMCNFNLFIPSLLLTHYDNSIYFSPAYLNSGLPRSLWEFLDLEHPGLSVVKIVGSESVSLWRCPYLLNDNEKCLPVISEHQFFSSVELDCNYPDLNVFKNAQFNEWLILYAQ